MAHPKAFVAIPTATPKGQPKSYLVSPVYHDGASTEDLISGEVLLSMTAMTPFLPANDEIPIEDCIGIARNEKDELLPPANWHLLTEKRKPYSLDPQKKLIEPLRLGAGDGRVVVPGARYKGLVGQSLGALFAAPFSRVGERTYSFRPNAVFPPTGKKLQREPRAAIVEGETPNGDLKIRVLPFEALPFIVFVRNAARARIDTTPGARQAGVVRGVQVVEERKRRRLKDVEGHVQRDFNYTGYTYFGGLDGDGIMARLFAQSMNRRGAPAYHHVLVENRHLPGQQEIVPKSILDHHQRTLDHLRNREEGHLRREHPLTHGKLKAQFDASLDQINQGIASAAKAIRTPNQLIYVEVQLDNAGEITHVNSIGANYYYLWRCLDSVRKIWAGVESDDRPITIPRPEERPQDTSKEQEHSPPRMLTMGRALLGYVSDDRNPGMAGIGKGDFAQMAGRFGFNNALELLPEGESGDANNRFLMPEHDCVVPLRVLSAPRPSAVEHHIQQPDSGPTKGYGESQHEPGGELTGYAYYVHQPDAATDPLMYSFERSDFKNIKSAQSSLARFVSPPGSVFRVRMRFANLRRWELAALLACLRPGLLAAPESHPFVTEAGSALPGHAIKLGRGRPLGLGSLDVSIDRVVTRDGAALSEAELREQLVAVSQILSDAGLQQTMTNWLAVHQYAGMTRACYPTANQKGEQKIVAHYSAQTQKFLRERRTW